MIRWTPRLLSRQARRATWKSNWTHRLRPNLIALERRDVPATITVTSLSDAVAADSFVTLREALNSINAGSDQSDVVADITNPYGTNDQINFSVTGTITLTGGELLASKSAIVNGPGASSLTIQQTTANRVIKVDNGAATQDTFSFIGLTITGGNIGGDAIASRGGGLGINTEVVTLTNCVITANTAVSSGGGIGTIATGAATISLVNCVVSNNNVTGAANDGGGIRLTTSQVLNVTSSTITGNNAGDDGGGIYVSSSAGLSIIDSAIINNRAGAASITDATGGGLWMAGAATGPLVVTNTTISGNSSQSNGGGVRMAASLAGTVEFNYCTIVGNRSNSNGGGLARDAQTSAGLTVTLTGTVIANNSAPIYADVFLVNPGVLNVVNAAIGTRDGYVISSGTLAVAPGTPMLMGIPANNGGATFTSRPIPGSPLINTGGMPLLPISDQVGNPRIDNGFADIGALEAISANPAAPVAVLSTPLATVDKPGGTSYSVTMTYYDDGLVSAASIDPTDLVVTGKPGAMISIPSPPMTNASSITVTYVITPPGGAWDITDNATYSISMAADAVQDTLGNKTGTGSVGNVVVAVGKIFTVTNTDPSDAVAGSLGNTIKAALADSPASGLVDLIRFDTGVFSVPQTINLTTAFATISDSLYIEGPGRDLLTLRQTGVARFFVIDSGGTAVAREFTLTGVTLREGNSGSGSGGAIQSNSEFVNLYGVRITANQAGNVGGAISILTTTGSRTTIVDSEITSNLTTGTGSHGGAISSSASPDHFIHIKNSVLSNNSAGGGGGAIYSQNSTILIEDSLLIGNQQVVGSATVSGGALYIMSPAAPADSARTILIRNSTLTDNKTLSSLGTAAGGGAIFMNTDSAGLVRIVGSTISNNSSPVKGGGISRSGGASPLVLVNTIVDANTAPIGSDIIGPGPVDTQNSLVSEATPPINDLGGTITNTSAQLTPIYLFGGSTPARATLPGSLAREAGLALDYAFDQRGNGFPRTVGSTDMGALEFALGTPIATAATVATMTFAPITMAGPDYTFKITYFDEAGIDTTTINGNDIRVQSAKTGYNKLASVVSITGPATAVEVTYKILPTNLTSWNFLDNGDYTISLEVGKVTDTGMAAVPATTFGSFNIGISAISKVTNIADSGAGSLRQAVLDANAAGAPATITFDTMGIFATPQTITLTTGELLISEDITIVGTGVGQLTVSGNTNSRLFNVFNSGKAIVLNASGMTLRDGKQFESTEDGGAIFNNGETVTMSNVVLTNNSSAGQGGAIYSQGGNVNLTDVVGSNNSATGRVGDGGFLFANIGGNISVVRSSITGNYAFDGGGAFYIAGATTVTLDRSTVSGNVADAAANSFGGGFYMGNGTTLTGTNSTISGNIAGQSGGGMRFSNATITLNSCTVAGNIARNRTPFSGSGGGGLYRTTGGTLAVLNLNNTVVADNKALNAGVGDDVNMQSAIVNVEAAAIFDINGWSQNGTMAVAPGTPLLLGPLTNNGGAFLTHLPAPSSPLRDSGTLVSPPVIDQLGTVRPIGAQVDVGAIESNGAVPVGIPSAFPDVTTAGGANYQFKVTYYDDMGIDTLTINNNNIRVVGPNAFDVPATLMMQTPVAGGIEATYEFNAPGGLWDNMDAGLYSVNLLANQVKDGGATAVAAATLGQFRVQLARNFVVTNTNDSGPGSLRQAVLNANDIQGTDGSDSISFDPAVFSSAQTITLTTNHLPITDSVRITGTGKSNLTINTAGRTRHFMVYGPGQVQFEITDVTLTGGKLTGGDTGSDAGGSMLIENEAVTIRRANVTNNSTNTNLVGGGAIMILAGNAALTIEESLFENNMARIGGAIRLSDAADPGIAVTIDKSIFKGNSATADGGAISCEDASLTVSNSTFVSNSSTGNGGAIILTEAGYTSNFDNCLFEGNSAANGGAMRLTDTAGGIIVNVRNTTMSGNTSTSAGGAISNNGASLSIFNSTIAANSAGNLTLGGGGIRHIATAGSVYLENTIIGDNTAPVSPDISAAFPVNVNNAIIENPAGSNASGTNLLNIDPLLGPLTNNGGPSKTHALLPGSPAIDAGTNSQGLFTDQRGMGFARTFDDPATTNGMSSDGTDIGAYEFQPTIPQVVSMAVNGGGVQRSLVTSVVVTFNNAVNFPGGLAAAFQVQRYANGGAATVGLDFNPMSGPASAVTITFNSSQMPLDPGGSLQDGTYRLTIVAANVSNTVGTLDGNGNFVSEGSPTDNYISQFHRLFGDGDGNGAVTASDFNAFRLDYGSVGPSIFDFDGISGVNATDFNAFRLRYGSSGYLP